MKSKTKIKEKKYQSHYLAIILAVVLILEGILFSVTTKVDWVEGTKLLDMSSAVTEISNDFATFFQPLTDTYADVNKFYEISAIEMTKLLDMSDSTKDIAFLWDGVNEFYEQASVQMAQLLDISVANNWQGRVSGISIEKEY